MKSHSFEQKAALRLKLEEGLAAISFFDLIEKSSKLAEQFERFSCANASIFHGNFILSFVPFETEPQINIEKEARDEPFRVGYVRILDWKKGLMEARAARRDLPGMWEEFELRNGNKVFQPKDSEPMCKSDELSVILVPGLAFTKDGKRLGRGVGFYDRFLALHPSALRVGVAFESQIMAQLPADTWDEDSDLILTDENIYSTKTYDQWKFHGKVLDRRQS